MTDDSTTNQNSNIVIPFLPYLRQKHTDWMNRTTPQLVLSDTAKRSRLWRAVDMIWQRLTVLSVLGVVVAIITPYPAFASETPHPGSKDSRIRDINYDPDQVVTIEGQFRHTIEIEFGAGETVTQAALGDTISWQIAPVGNIVFLKPREKAGATNLIVITQGNNGTRTYHFNLVMGTGTIMYGVRFRYPREERQIAELRTALATIQTAKVAEDNVVNAALDHAVIEGVRNMNYTEQGDSALQPTEISDNGEFTVLRYPGHADIPSIFAVDVDGTETIVPYDVREDFVVIHAVYRELRLRRGTSVLCIWNEAPPRNDRGDRTGTVSNIVERKIKEQANGK